MKSLNLYIVPLLAVLIFITACKSDKTSAKAEGAVYTCPMHPQIIRDEPGNCPICGMELVKKEQNMTGNTLNDSLQALLRPTDEFVVSSLPVVTLQQSADQMELNVLGSVQYDNQQVHALSSRVSGRIEKLYVRFRYQFVNKGQKVLEIYSPELLTAQENLILISRTDPGNHSLISAARQRLLLLGMSGQQVAQILRTGRPLYSVAVYSPYAGYITERGFTQTQNMNNGNANGMQAENSTNMTNAVQAGTTELPVKEGMYVDRAQPIFSLIDASRGRISLSIFSEQQHLVKVGTPVLIVPETSPAKKFRATIDFIEPFFQPGSKTLSARVYFNNATLQLPIGSQVQATIFTPPQTAYWLPASAVLTTGLRNLVFKKENGGFSPKVVTTGFRNNDRVQITGGLSPTDSVAVNAQHLTESESIITVNEQK